MTVRPADGTTRTAVAELLKATPLNPSNKQGPGNQNHHNRALDRPSNSGLAQGPHQNPPGRDLDQEVANPISRGGASPSEGLEKNDALLNDNLEH